MRNRRATLNERAWQGVARVPCATLSVRDTLWLAPGTKSDPPSANRVTCHLPFCSIARYSAWRCSRSPGFRARLIDCPTQSFYDHVQLVIANDERRCDEHMVPTLAVDGASSSATWVVKKLVCT